MIAPPEASIPDSRTETLAAVREYFSLNPLEPVPEPCELARTLRARFLHRPNDAEAAAALEALEIEGEVLA